MRKMMTRMIEVVMTVLDPRSNHTHSILQMYELIQRYLGMVTLTVTGSVGAKWMEGWTDDGMLLSMWLEYMSLLVTIGSCSWCCWRYPWSIQWSYTFQQGWRIHQRWGGGEEKVDEGKWNEDVTNGKWDHHMHPRLYLYYIFRGVWIWGGRRYVLHVLYSLLIETRNHRWGV